MAVSDPSIEPRILESAKAEFLALGFKKASLKTICAEAGVTTGALYKRYKGKDELFCAVVGGDVAALNAVLKQKADVDVSTLSDQALIKAWDMDEGYMVWWFKLLYAHHDGLVLLLRCAEGSSYSNFQHDWVEQMTSSTYAYYSEARRRGLATYALTVAEMHVLLSAFWTTIYEPFIDDFPWEAIEDHCKIVCRLFDWYHLLGFPKG